MSCTLHLGSRKQQHAFADEAAHLAALDSAMILAALLQLAYAIEALLRAMPQAKDQEQAGQAIQLSPYTTYTDAEVVESFPL